MFFLFYPIIFELINYFLTTAIFPSALKKSIITSTIEKLSLDPFLPTNYRAISNFFFIFKDLENVFYFEANTPLPSTQSGVRTFHSTEISLLKIYNDSLLSCDKVINSLFICLDLLSDFDNVDHFLLIQQHEFSFGKTGFCFK